MDIAIVGFFASFFLSLISTPFFRKLALKMNIVDEPDSRKIHKKPIPYLGGLGFYFSFFSVLLFLFFSEQNYFTRNFVEKYPIIFMASTAIVLMGIVDDILGLKAGIKLLIEIFIGIFMYYNGFAIERITIPFSGSLELGKTGIIFTILWFVAIMNAINLSDGLDGLAGGISFISALSMGAIFYKSGSIHLSIYCFVLAGAILGFLKYNYNPASVFMGDTGSLLLGYLLATVALWESQKTTSLVTLLVPIVATALPILDTILAFFRRIIKGKHPFKPDKKHLHHRLLEIGLTQKQAVFFMYFLSVYFGIMAFLLANIPVNYVLPLVILLALFLFGLYWMLIFLEQRIIPMQKVLTKYTKKREKKK